MKRKHSTGPASSKKAKVAPKGHLASDKKPATAPVRPLFATTDRETAFRKAIEDLSLQTNPSLLVGREEEQGKLSKYLRDSLVSRQAGASLYMCGMPGTGKTATYLYIVSKMIEEVKSGSLPDFVFLNINCMTLSKPEEIYQLFAKQLLGKRLSESRVVPELNKYFKGEQRGKKKVVVVVDEIDALITKKQEVLYHVFDWPTQPHSELIITGISNTMDLAERFLPRVASRLGRNRIVFAPYRKSELEELVRQRLKDTDVFSEEAVSFAATKIAGFSGDARRALQTCRLAAEICLKTESPHVTLEHIQAAHHELYSFSFIKALPYTPYLSRLVLLRLALKVKSKASTSVTLQELMEDMRSLGGEVVGTRVPTRTEMQDLLAVLGALKLLLVDGQVYKMLVSIDEVCQALQREERFKGFLSLF